MQRRTKISKEHTKMTLWRSTRHIRKLVTASLVASATNIAIAQPEGKAIQVITPAGAGGATDVIVRSMLPVMSSYLNRPLVIENMPGVGGVIGTTAVTRAPTDGSSIGVATSGALAANPHLQKKLPFNPTEDFAYICRIGTGPYILSVHPSKNIKNLPELLQKSKQQDLTFASPGVGSSAHIAQELFKSKTESNFVHVPYKGTGQAINDAVGGHTDVIFEAPGPLMAHIKAGKLIPIGVSSEQRLQSMPEIPTFAELGYKDIVLEGWIGLFAKAGTAAPIIDNFSKACEEALKNPVVLKQAQSLGFEVKYLSSSDFTKFASSEYKHWGNVINITGLKQQ